MLENGIIRSSQSPFFLIHPIGEETNDSWQLYVYYRALYNETIKIKFPIPIVDELLDKLYSATIFNKLDLRSSYYKIRVHHEDILKITFRTHEGHYNSW